MHINLVLERLFQTALDSSNDRQFTENLVRQIRGIVRHLTAIADAYEGQLKKKQDKSF
jgi:hypothetical protein